jgi:hypothetical protein
MRIRTLVFTLACVVALPVICHAQDEESSKAIELKACGSGSEVDFSHKTDKGDHTMGVQSPDKALIYIIRDTMLGNAIQTKLAVDGQWVGVNKGNNYFFISVTPGTHYFCSRAENHSAIELTVEAGKTYYLHQEVEMGIMKARTKLEVMDADKALKKLPKLNLSMWETK